MVLSRGAAWEGWVADHRHGSLAHCTCSGSVHPGGIGGPFHPVLVVRSLEWALIRATHF